MKKVVEVRFWAMRDEEMYRDWWLRVSVTPQEPEYVEAIRILYYQYGFSDERLGLALRPYEMENGKAYGWGIDYGDVVVILVRYRDKRYGEQVAAQGVWWSDGEHLRSGRILYGRSELFA
jgi:hypothetical protein